MAKFYLLSGAKSRLLATDVTDNVLVTHRSYAICVKYGSI